MLNRQITVTRQLSIEGCNFTVSENLQFRPKEVYWMKNDEKIFANLSISSAQNKQITYKFPNIDKVPTFEDQGLYRCVLDFNGLESPIYSPTLNISIQGMNQVDYQASRLFSDYPG